MLNYLKSSAAAIVLAVLSLSGILLISGDSFTIDEFYSIFIFAACFGYFFGLLGLVCLYVVKQKDYRHLKSYFLFFLLGVFSGGIVEFITESMLFPMALIATVLGSLTFLSSQNIKSKTISWILSVIPPFVIFGFPLFW